MLNKEISNAYIDILKEELVPAMGCTEPIQTPKNRKLLTVERIVEFANEVHISDVEDILKRQIDYNIAISKAGLEGHYGAEIGKILLRSYGNVVQNRAKAWAAAGSDARMNGCELPVVINSGSGKQLRNDMRWRKSKLCGKNCICRRSRIIGYADV